MDYFISVPDSLPIAIHSVTARAGYYQRGLSTTYCPHLSHQVRQENIEVNGLILHHRINLADSTVNSPSPSVDAYSVI